MMDRPALAGSLASCLNRIVPPSVKLNSKKPHIKQTYSSQSDRQEDKLKKKIQ